MLRTHTASADFEYLSEFRFNFQSIPQFFQSQKKKEFSNFRTAADPQSRANPLYLLCSPLGTAARSSTRFMYLKYVCASANSNAYAGGGRWVAGSMRQATAAVAQLGVG